MGLDLWIAKVLASSSLLGLSDLGLIVVGYLLFQCLKSWVNNWVSWELLAGENPNVIGFANVQISAWVNNSEGLVVSGEDSVISSWRIGEELNWSLSTVKGCSGGCFGDFVSNWVVLWVEDWDSAVGVKSIASLLAVIGFPRHASVSGLFVPESHISLSLEVGLEAWRRAWSCWEDSGSGKANKG